MKKIKNWQVSNFSPLGNSRYVAELLITFKRGPLEWVLGWPPLKEIRFVQGTFETLFYGVSPVSELDFPGCSYEIAEELVQEYAWAERMGVLAPDLIGRKIAERPRDVFKPRQNGIFRPAH